MHRTGKGLLLINNTQRYTYRVTRLGFKGSQKSPNYYILIVIVVVLFDFCQEKITFLLWMIIVSNLDDSQKTFLDNLWSFGTFKNILCNLLEFVTIFNNCWLIDMIWFKLILQFFSRLWGWKRFQSHSYSIHLSAIIWKINPKCFLRRQLYRL